MTDDTTRQRLTHVRADGSAHMVDVSAKPVTVRAATAVGRVLLQAGRQQAGLQHRLAVDLAVVVVEQPRNLGDIIHGQKQPIAAHGRAIGAVVGAQRGQRAGAEANGDIDVISHQVEDIGRRPGFGFKVGVHGLGEHERVGAVIDPHPAGRACPRP